MSDREADEAAGVAEDPAAHLEVEDLLIRDLGAPAASVAAALLDLEMGGRVLRHPGSLVSLAV